MQVTFYKNCKIQPNHYIQNLSDYLSNLNDYSTNLTTCKAFASDEDSFSIRISVSDLSDLSNWNYVEIASDNIIRYYFVTGFRYISESIYEFDLALDVVNTYQTDIMKNDNFRQVKINRRHKNRWKIGSDSNYYRIYDKVDEGLGDVATEVERSEPLLNANEYLIITRQIEDTDLLRIGKPLLVNEVVTNSSTTVTRTSYEYSITDLNLTEEGSHWILIIGDSSDTLISGYLDDYGLKGYNCLFNCALIGQYTYENKSSIFLGSRNGDYFRFDKKIELGKYGDTTFRPLNAQNVRGNGSFKTYVAYTLNQFVYGVPSLDTNYVLSDWFKGNYTTIESSISRHTITLNQFSTIDRIDSTIKSITAIPLTPAKIASLNYLSFPIVSNELISASGNIYVNTSLGKITKSVQERDKTYESKLYGSYVRNSQIVYDTFSLAVQPEFYDGDIQYVNYTIYKPIDMTNDVAIKINNLKQQEVNSNVLTCNRNNTVTSWTNEYLEYVRNGYNYDNKAKSLQNIKNGLNIGANVLGTSLNFFKGGKTLGPYAAIQSGINVATGIVNSIISDKENNLALKQKRQSLINTSPTMNGSDNYLLFKELNGGNCFKYVITKPNEDVETNIWNLFYYTGYADNLYYNELPTIKSRVYFNYLEADIGYVNLDDRKEITRLKDAFKSGITFEWNYNDTWLMEGNLYENWETTY